MIKKKINAFTLVEMLVVISVLSLVGVVILTIFTRTLRGNNKAQILSVIKQNGQAVLENMGNSIRNADSILCLNSPSDTSNTLVVKKAGSYIRYRLILPTVGTTGTNGRIEQDNPSEAIPGSDINFESVICTDADPMGKYGSTNILTDNDSKTGVSIQCIDGTVCNTKIFKSDKPAGFNATVTINFFITSGVGASPSLIGQVDPVDFTTTIQIR